MALCMDITAFMGCVGEWFIIQALLALRESIR